ncbi:MAG: N-acetyltransferase [Acidimicrobiia bacterium]|nr:N-acetyltransferase [Acidimicrobiia bacterium]
MKSTAEKVMIHPTANVEATAVLGDGTRVWHREHVRDGAFVGGDCTISKDVYIDTEVRIGNRVKIQNGVSVYKGVLLEDDVFVGPNVSFTNDAFPRAFNDDWHITSTLVRRGASIGANATVVCGVTLGPYSMVAAGSTVTNDAPPTRAGDGQPRASRRLPVPSRSPNARGRDARLREPVPLRDVQRDLEGLLRTQGILRLARLPHRRSGAKTGAWA